MGWKDELHDASFRGVQFECTSVSGAQAKTVAIHQARTQMMPPSKIWVMMRVVSRLMQCLLVMTI